MIGVLGFWGFAVRNRRESHFFRRNRVSAGQVVLTISCLLLILRAGQGGEAAVALAA